MKNNLKSGKKTKISILPKKLKIEEREREEAKQQE